MKNNCRRSIPAVERVPAMVERQADRLLLDDGRLLLPGLLELGANQLELGLLLLGLLLQAAFHLLACLGQLAHSSSCLALSSAAFFLSWSSLSLRAEVGVEVGLLLLQGLLHPACFRAFWDWACSSQFLLFELLFLLFDFELPGLELAEGLFILFAGLVGAGGGDGNADAEQEDRRGPGRRRRRRASATRLGAGGAAGASGLLASVGAGVLTLPAMAVLSSASKVLFRLGSTAAGVRLGIWGRPRARRARLLLARLGSGGFQGLLALGAVVADHRLGGAVVAEHGLVEAGIDRGPRGRGGGRHLCAGRTPGKASCAASLAGASSDFLQGGQL